MFLSQSNLTHHQLLGLVSYLATYFYSIHTIVILSQRLQCYISTLTKMVCAMDAISILLMGCFVEEEERYMIYGRSYAIFG